MKIPEVFLKRSYSLVTLVVKREGLIVWRNSENSGSFSETILFFVHAGSGTGMFDCMRNSENSGSFSETIIFFSHAGGGTRVFDCMRNGESFGDSSGK